jgi:hypothetical protein
MDSSVRRRRCFSQGILGLFRCLGTDSPELRAGSTQRELDKSAGQACQVLIMNTSNGTPNDSAKNLAKLFDTEMKLRIDAMITNYGQDERTSPLEVLDSRLSADVLIPSLLKLRSQTLNRLSDEALSDVEATNAIIDGLRYRGH